MTPTPPPSFVKEMHRYDPTLRLRWSIHRAMWLIDVKVAPQQPAYLKERPSPLSNTPIGKDRWESWKEGYLHVMYVHPENLRWTVVAPTLHHLSLLAHKAGERLVDRLEALEEAEEKAADRAWSNKNEAFAKDLFDRLQWDEGRAVSLFNPDPYAPMEQHDGFVVHDRRVRV